MNHSTKGDLIFFSVAHTKNSHRVKVLSIPFVVSWKIQFTFLNVTEVIHSKYLAGFSRLPFDPRITWGISVTSDILKPIFETAWPILLWVWELIGDCAAYLSSKCYYCNIVLRSVNCSANRVKGGSDFPVLLVTVCLTVVVNGMIYLVVVFIV